MQHSVANGINKNQPKNQTYADVAVIPNSIGKVGKSREVPAKAIAKLLCKKWAGKLISFLYKG
jgi:hypothetical protein